MTQSDSVLKKIQERIQEKDEVIGEQMRQIVSLEDEVARLRDQVGELESFKTEYDRIKKELDSLLGS